MSLWVTASHQSFFPPPTRHQRRHLLLRLPSSTALVCRVSAAPPDAKPETPLSLNELCSGHVPQHVLRRMDELGYVVPTDVQKQALPVLFSGRDCVIHSQTGSGKTLAYLLLILSVVNTRRSSVQACIVVPTRELGIQVTKVARRLVGKPTKIDMEDKSCTVMALLDGGMLQRQKSWLKAEPPSIVVATIGSLCQMLRKHTLKLDSMRILVIDEVDFMFNSPAEVNSLRKLLNTYSSCNNRQTVFASASLPQHRRFLSECVQQKWTRGDVVHVHVDPVESMPSFLNHRFVVCHRNKRLQALLSLLQIDKPEFGIIFVGQQSEKSKKAGNPQPTTLLLEFLKSSYDNYCDVILLEEEMNFNSRAATLSEAREKPSRLYPQSREGREEAVLRPAMLRHQHHIP
ncbi:hypothetical protein MLD38_038434 [Melastoma candidum]|uniref:Uncharacterized protein n=1 Tax=Melastoma candidum TaxID=119954 RepID=A0ACB9KZ69_9MYRT|nr:hypothetical protein MLD38_038434 [Melastoma candidum]